MKAIKLPEGIIFNLQGPTKARRRDITLYIMSGIEKDPLDGLVFNQRQFYLYGDPAYCLSSHLLIPFEKGDFSVHERRYNESMESVRKSVERGFNDVRKYFT